MWHHPHSAASFPLCHRSRTPARRRPPSQVPNPRRHSPNPTRTMDICRPPRRTGWSRGFTRWALSLAIRPPTLPSSRPLPPHPLHQLRATRRHGAQPRRHACAGRRQIRRSVTSPALKSCRLKRRGWHVCGASPNPRGTTRHGQDAPRRSRW